MSGCIIDLVTVMNLKKQTQNMNLNNVIVSLGIESQYMIFLTNVQKNTFFIIARERIIESNQARKKSEYKFLVTMKAK